MAVVLTKHVRALRGGSQPQLMQADDGNLYVVKFQKNPQGTSILANEMLANKLARFLGLPVPATVVVQLPREVSKELYFETPGGREPICPGFHLGSRLVVKILEGRCYDVLPQSFVHLIRNSGDLAGIRLFDLWACNRDTRQLVYWKYSQDKKYSITFIDNGHCFGGPDWHFDPVNQLNSELAEGSNSQDCLHWANLIATFPIEGFARAEADLIPPEWFAEGQSFAPVFEELRIRQAVLAASPLFRRPLSRRQDFSASTASYSLQLSLS